MKTPKTHKPKASASCYAEATQDKPETRAKIQYKRKLGHLWQVLYGTPKGKQFYGYGATQARATAQASQRWEAAQ